MEFKSRAQSGHNEEICLIVFEFVFFQVRSIRCWKGAGRRAGCKERLLQIPGRYPTRVFFKPGKSSDQTHIMKEAWSKWLQQQMFVMFDHLRKLKRQGIPSKMENSLDAKLIENLEIYIGVIPEPKSSPPPCTKKFENTRVLSRWDSGVSAATSCGSEASVPAAQPTRWDSGVSSCSDADEAKSHTSSSDVQMSGKELCLNKKKCFPFLYVSNK